LPTLPGRLAIAHHSNAWNTNARFHADVARCRFSCAPDACDCMRHYLACDVAWHFGTRWLGFQQEQRQPCGVAFVCGFFRLPNDVALSILIYNDVVLSAFNALRHAPTVRPAKAMASRLKELGRRYSAVRTVMRHRASPAGVPPLASLALGDMEPEHGQGPRGAPGGGC
jgi:hypothetical protein